MHPRAAQNTPAVTAATPAQLPLLAICTCSPPQRWCESHTEANLSSSGSASIWKPAVVDTQPAILGRRIGSAEIGVSKLLETGQLKKAVDALDREVQAGSSVSVSLFCRILKQCSAHNDVHLGQRVHHLILKVGYGANTLLSNHTIRMYASQGKLQQAVNVFTRVTAPDVFTWSSVINAHIKQGQAKQAIKMYRDMICTSVKPDCHVFVAALQACATAHDLESGRQVHADLLKSGIQPDLFVWNCLVDMYSKCGSLEDARSVFDRLPRRDVVTWNAIINGYAEQECCQDALSLHEKMEQEGIIVSDRVTFACLLKACAAVRALAKGKLLHAQIRERGFCSDVTVATCLVNMYSKCGRLDEARAVFDSMPTRNVVTWNAMIAGYAEHGLGDKAICLFGEMEQRGMILADPVTFCCLLKACTSAGSLVHGRQLHAKILDRGLESDMLVANSLVNMYAKLGRLDYARRVFDSLPAKDVVTWNTMIVGYTEHKHDEEAISLYKQMEQQDVSVANNVTFSWLLKACGGAGALVEGQQLHEKILGLGLESDILVGSALVNMYAQWGRLKDARMVFDSLPRLDLGTWNVMIAAYAERQHIPEAYSLLEKMEQQGDTDANSLTFVHLLKACTLVRAVEHGKQLHAKIIARGLESDFFVGNSLLSMYAKWGRLEDAHMVFDTLPVKDLVTWNAMISGYAEHAHSEQALALYETMEQQGVIVADFVTYTCLLKACSTAGALFKGKQLHAKIRERGLESDIVVGSSIVNMYCKCGSLEDARKVFDSMPTKDVVTWNTMIDGYAEKGHSQEAMLLFEDMEQEGMEVANSVTFACLLKACASVGALVEGKKLHSIISQRGLESDVVMGNCLVNMYGSCGRLDEARAVFDGLPTKDVVTWNVMLGGCVEHEQGQEAFLLYDRMKRQGIVVPDSVTYTCLLKACIGVGDLVRGKQLHSEILENGLESDVVVGNTLLSMYAKCGSLDEARNVFDTLPRKDVVTWTSMLAAYAEHEDGREALHLYGRMEHEGMILADPVMFACLLKACTAVGALAQGKALHSQIIERGLESDVFVSNSLVNLYAKCGKMEDARRVFDSLRTRDVVTWTVLINGYGQSSQGHKAIECFQEMLEDGVQANETTLTCLLVACSHDGLVKEGLRFFNNLVGEQGIVPTTEHYNCMVDLLGRAGYLEEAERTLLACQTNDVGLMSLLNACRSHGDIERGIRCFNSLIRSDPQNAGAYVLMGYIYANAGRWSDVERIETLRKLAGASKKAAVAGIEVDRHVHTFVVGEAKGDISCKIRSTNTRLKEEGSHMPRTELVLKPLSDKEKEDELCGHAEKLALAYGLLNTPDGTPLLVTKNLRMCGDCHTSTEILSRVENREIIVRDAHRVHCFLNGSCGCGGRP